MTGRQRELLVAADAAYYRARGAAERGQTKACRDQIERLIDALCALVIYRQATDPARREAACS